MLEHSQHNRSITIGRDAVGNVLVSGDNNQVRVTLVVADERLLSATRAPHAQEGSAGNPYRGLDSFQEADADLFFGRRKLIRRAWVLFQKLQTGNAPRILPVIGASGSGKSSLVRAGLLPELVREPMQGLESPNVLIFRPGREPLARLAEVLSRIPGIAVLAEAAFKSPTADGTFDQLHRLLHSGPEASRSRVVIVVDQFEELFTMCEDSEARTALLENLAFAAMDSDRLVSIVLTLRNDFAAAVRSPAAFFSAVRESRLLVKVMDSEELREAIVRPAVTFRYAWPPILVDSLVTQAEGRAGSLPLLQFALKRLWPDLSAGRLNESQWSSRLIEDFLVQAADALYDTASDSGENLERNQRIIRRAFLAMVQLGEGTEDTRRVARLAEIVASGEDPELIRRVLAPLSAPEARLITVSEMDGEPTFELTHESLIGSWDRLRMWLGDVPELDRRERIRADLRLQRRLSAAANDWRRGRSGLWRTPELDLLQEYVIRSECELTEDEQAFAKQSNRQARREWHLRAGSIVLLAVLFIAAVFGSIVARRETRTAESERTNAAIGFARSLIANGSPSAALKILRDRVAASNPDAPIDYDLAAVLYSALWKDHLVASTTVPDANEVLWDKATGQLIVRTSGEELRFTDVLQVASRRPNSFTTHPESEQLNDHKLWSPDGSRYILATDWSNIELRDKSDKVILTIGDRPFMKGLEPDLYNFSPDSALLFLAHVDKEFSGPEVVEATTGQQLFPLEVTQEKVMLSCFSPASDRLATLTEGGVLSVWTTAHNRFSGGSSNLKVREDDGEISIVVSASQAFVVRTSSRQVIFHRAVDSTFAHEYPNHKISPDKKYIWIKPKNNSAELWSLVSGQMQQRAVLPSVVSRMYFSPSGRYAIVTNRKQSWIYTSSGPPMRPPVKIADDDGSDDPLYDTRESVIMFPDRNRGSIRVWHLDTGKLLHSLQLNDWPDSISALTSNDSPNAPYAVAWGGCYAIISDGQTPRRSCGKIPVALIDRGGNKLFLFKENNELYLRDPVSGAKVSSFRFEKKILKASVIHNTTLAAILAEENEAADKWQLTMFDYARWQPGVVTEGCYDTFDFFLINCDRAVLFLTGARKGQAEAVPDGVLTSSYNQSLDTVEFAHLNWPTSIV